MKNIFLAGGTRRKLEALGQKRRMWWVKESKHEGENERLRKMGGTFSYIKKET